MNEEVAASVGLIAGGGELPILVARTLAERKRSVVVCTVVQDADPALEEVATHTRHIELDDLETIPDYLERRNVRDVVMVGKVDRTLLYEDERVAGADETARELLGDLHDKGDLNLIEAGADYLRERGFRILGLDEVLRNRFTPSGLLAGPAPSEDERRTLAVLEAVTRDLVEHEVGQSSAGKRQSVVAVEGAEGTDAMIRRAGALAGPGCVVLKLARRDQDRRYDVPVVGRGTLRTLVDVEASVLAVEADRTLWLQREACRRMARQHGISLLGWQPDRGSRQEL